ncbi:MAG: ADOP family duplicated permease [Candidatus Acidiferrales bacterium]
MRWLRAMLVRLSGLFGRERRDADLAAEMESHLQMHMDDNVRAGMSAAEARRRALMQLGGVEQAKEIYRDQRGFPVVENFLQDLRYGARMLRKNPGFTLVTVLTLALGIGANTAIFSIVDAVLLRPLPYRDPARVMTVWQSLPRRQIVDGRVSPANFLDWKARNTVFQDLAAITYWNLDYAGQGEPETFLAELVSKDFFNLLGVRAAVGRTFLPEEFESGRDKVIVLSHGLWERRFGGDPNVIGRKITFSTGDYVIAGVLPADFTLPWLGREREVFAPLAFTPDDQKVRGDDYLHVMGRLKPGVTVEQARAAMAPVAARLAEEYPTENAGVGINVVPVLEKTVGKVRPMLLALLAAVGLVLLTGCVNVANLLLARGSSRQREMAIRIALGAGRARLMRQLLTESFLLAAMGCAGGLLFARWSAQLLVALRPGDIPRLSGTMIDSRVFLFAVGISFFTALIFGLAPSIQVSRADLQGSLKESGGRAGAGAGRKGLRSALVVTEMTLAVMLLVGAGLLVRSFVNLIHVNPGYISDRVIGLQVFVWDRYSTPDLRRSYFEQAIQNVAALPGVEHVGAVSSLPLLLGSPRRPVSFGIEGRAPVRPDQRPAALEGLATPGYFGAMGIPLLRGRLFDSSDRRDSRPAVLINQTMARKFWPGEDPVGKEISLSGSQGGAASRIKCEIVGIVGDVHQTGPESSAAAEFFRPHAQDPSGSMAFVVRTNSDPMLLLKPIEGAIWQANSTIPFYTVNTLRQLLENSWSNRRFSVVLLGGFALLALILAMIGIYGVVSYSTGQRTREIGIRMALGAQRGDVMGMVLGQGMRLVLLGVAVGIVGALVMGRLLSSLLFGVSALDPVTFFGVGMALILVTLAACYIPARRAMCVDPVIALRYE